MNGRFYLRAGIALFASAMLALCFTYGRNNASASQYAVSSNTVSDHQNNIADISNSTLSVIGLGGLASRPFVETALTKIVWPLSLVGADSAKAIQMGCSTASFAAAPTSPEPVGADAHYVGIGYINGDTHLDIVTTDNNTASLTILLGDGTGNFTPTASTPFPVGTNPVTVEIGDFNHDNNSDLVVTNEGSNSLSVLLGDGTGNFINAPGSPIVVGAFPRSVAIGNFNGDANPDLVVTNGGSDNLSILLGNGDGTFTPASGSPVTSAGAPFHAIIGHYNADAFFDLAVANLGAGAMTIFLGDGSGGFTQFGAAIPVGTFTAFLAQGDFNGDSKTDLAAVNRLDNNLVVFLGNGNGGFTQASGSPYSVGIAPMAVAAGDLNLDGILDLAVANETGGTTSIFLGNGNGTFNLSTLVTKGQLPTHMALADFNEDGKLDIATSDAGDNTVTILLNTCNACTTITVNPATISTATVGTSYSESFSGTGGTAPYGLALTGTLPNGLSFNDPTLSGTPTQFGSFPITVTATDFNGCTGSRNYTLVVNCQTITVDPTTIPAGTANTAYSQTFTHTGGIGATTFSLTGALPTGLTFSGATLSGTPTQTGSFPITVTATDSNGCTGSRNYTLVINCQTITVNPTTIPTGTANTAYSQTFTQTGGIGTTAFAVTGTLPTGLTFSGATLSGTPTQTGSFPITVTATDSNGCTGNRGYTLVINCQTITVNPATTPAGIVSTAYSQTFTHTGGIGTTTFSLTGALPTGITFSGATLLGTPTQTGSFPITVTATDSNGCTGSRNYTLVINCQTITVNPATIPNGTANTPYSQSFSHTGGIGTTTFALTGTLPTGLTFSGATLSGTPTQTGSFPITVTATDANGCTGTRNYTLVINCQTITVNPATISSGTANSVYSQSFTQTGGIGTTTFALTGTLPTGLTFSGATLSGTPTQTGSFPITITATDSNGCTGNRGYTLIINCQTITVNPPTIPSGTAGSAYSQTFTHTGGIGTTTFSLTGTLPTGLSLTGATLSGTPTQTGSFPITVTATDANGCTGSRGYTLVIGCQTISVTPSTIPAGTAGSAYSQTFSHTGGIGTVTFGQSGKLPAGITFTGATLSGTPTQVGSYPITITATDANGCTGSRNYTLVINCQSITVNPTTIPVGTVSTAYSQSFTQSGGIGTTSFSLTGTLPAGLSFSGSALSGTPTQPGSFPITVTATDSNGCTGSRNYTLVINCQTLTVNPATIPNGTVSTAYSQTFTQTGGVGTVTFSLTGTLPTGLTFSGATLSGTPTQSGNFPITVTATDSNNCTGGRSYTLVINCQTISILPATIPAGTAGMAYSQTFTSSNGIGTVTFDQSGKLPAGITFTGATLSGTPTQTGTYPISITATDANNCSSTRNYTLVINCQSLTVNPTTIPAGTAGTAYSQTFTQTGGIGTTTFSLTGTLPNGVTFTGATLAGTPTQSGSFPITVTATDSNGCTGSRGYTLVINCQTITVNPTTIPAGTAGTAYSQTFTQTGGIGTTTFSLTGTLPNGMSLTGATLSGTPTQSGSFPVTVKATDANGCMGTRSYTLVINCQTITVNPTTISAGMVGTFYSRSFTHTGGIGTTTFALTGTLPNGITFSGSTLSGTPTQAGNFPITVTATDANGCTGSRNYTLVVCASITVNPTTIARGAVGSPYTQTFTQIGGVGSTAFSLTGTLPTGMTFTSPTLSGTPSQSGSFPITVTATDSNGCIGSRNYTLVICASITISPATIPAGTAGSAYSQTFTQTGGVGTTTFGLTGTLPLGMTFSGATLSGTPTQTGNFPISVSATDSNGCTGSRSYTLVINCQTINVNPLTIPSGAVGVAYSQSFTQTGGIGTTSFSLTGALPTGITFSGATLSGTPTQSGSFPLTVSAMDINGCIGSRDYTLLINCQTLTVNPATIPNGTVSTAYSQTFTQTGGVGTVTFSLTGTLPTGLTFSGATLSGTPTQSGNFPITVTATDSNNCTGGRSYTLVINCQTISILPATIPAGTAGTAYSQTFTSSNGIGTVTFDQSGKLPAGITFTGATLSGTPTQTGTYPISITATDANNCSSTRNYTLVINCQSLTVNPTTIPAGTAGTAYSQTFTQTGGIGTTTFSLIGTLPNGVTFTGATLAGTPTQSGSFPITVTATDSNGCTGSRGYTLVINCQTITVNPATIPSGTASTPYSQTFTQSGGIGTTTFNLTGTLPSGLTFTGATLSGTTSQTGTFPITVIATDSNGCTGSRNYTLVINCQGFTVNPATIPAGTLGTAYFQTFTHTGGIGAVTFNLTGTLPTGLTFSGATLSGTPTQTGSFPVTVTATDSNSCVSSRNYTLVINCQTITVDPATIPAGTAGTGYSQTFTQTGGIGTTTLSLTGTLPTGLAFSGGALSGTPTQTGSFPITVIATDSNGCTGSRNYTLVINCQTITVNPATIPAGTAGTAYSQTFTQVGGIGTTTFSLTGTLPTGVTFSGAALSGTPTQTGNFPVTVKATDANGCMGTRNYTLVINCPASITVNPATLPNGFVGISYGSQALSATGGIAPYTFTVSAGTLPGGITLSGATLSGSPTTGGTFNFTIQAADSNGCTGTRAYTVIISGGAKGTGLQFYPLPAPVRLLDTRSGETGCFTPGAQIPGNTSRTQPAAGSCSIPATAQAVTGNITTVQSGGGYLTLYPSDATQPTVSNSNYLPNQIMNNVFTVGLGASDGAFKIFVNTSADVIVDITGYYAPPGTGGLYFHPLPKPIRLLETRTGETGCFATGTPLPGGVDTVQQGTTTCSGVTIPSTALALFGNATTVNPVLAGYLNFFPANATRPLVANGNFVAGQILNSPFTVGLSPTGQFKIFTTAQTDLVIDIQGYYSADAVDVNGQGLLFTPLPTPVRLLDTRNGFTGCFTPGAPLQAAVEQSQLARGTCTIGSSAQAIVGNATVVNDPVAGFLTLWPSNAVRPFVSSSNWVANQVFNRYFTVGLGSDGKFKMYASGGTDLVVDVSGYFAP